MESLRIALVTRLHASVQNSTPPLSVLFMRSAQPESGLSTSPSLFNVAGIWSLRQAVWIWGKHIAINGFPEKIPKVITHTHLFKCTREWLCFLTGLLVVSCLGSEGGHRSLTPHHSIQNTQFVVCVCFRGRSVHRASPGASQPVSGFNTIHPPA